MTNSFQKRLELIAEEVDQLQKSKLFNPDETKVILETRKDFEHKIEADTRTVKDFTDYISYEKNLLKDIVKRRGKCKKDKKKGNAEHRIFKRVKLLYDVGLQQFTNCPLLTEYLRFCKKFNSSLGSEAVASMLKKIPEDPEIWYIAGRWHAYDCDDTNKGLSLLLKGISRHKDSSMLYKEMIHIELFEYDKPGFSKENSQEIYVKRIQKIVNNTFPNITGSDFYIELLEFLEKYPFTKNCQDSIIEHLIKNNSDDENVWDFLAQRERRDPYCKIENIETIIIEDDESENVESTSSSTAIPTSSSTAIPTSSTTPIPTSSSTAIPTSSTTPIPTSSSTAIPTSSTTPIPTSSSTAIPTSSTTPIPTSSSTAIPTSSTTPIPTSSSTAIPTSSSTAIPKRSPKTRLLACIDKYKQGLASVPSSKKPRLWQLYIDYLLKLHQDQSGACKSLKVETLKAALTEACEENSLLEHHYIAWLKLIDRNDALPIAEKGTIAVPESADLWKKRLRLQMLKDNKTEVDQVFKKGIIALKEKALPLWSSILRYHVITSDDEYLELIYVDALKQPHEIANALKPKYLEWLALIKGTDVAREAYKKLAEEKPYCKEIHKVMARLEASEMDNFENWGKVHKLACDQFGKEDMDVWLSYLRFYLFHNKKISNHRQIVEKLYKLAINTIPHESRSLFVTKVKKLMRLAILAKRKKVDKGPIVID